MGRSLGDAWVTVRPDMSQFPHELNSGVDRAKRGFGTSVGKLAATAGVAMGAAGTYGAVAFAKGSVKLEAEFGKTMNQLQAATGTPKRGMRELSDLAMKMGTDTVFSASDASEAMLELARQGIGPATIKAGALESALTLAAAGGVSMERAATVMGNALNAFNIKGSQSEKVAAALAGAANASSASVDSLAQGLQQAATVAADAGFTLEETTGAIAALANAGIDGSDAGTSLKTMFSRLVPTTKQAFEAMQSYGLVNYDANIAARTLAEDGLKATSNSYEDVYKAVSTYLVQQGVAKEGTVALANATEDYLQTTGIMHNAFLKQNGDFKSLSSIAGTLKSRLSGLSDSERATALNTMFGSDARRAATVLMNEGTKGLAKYIRATSDKNAADRMAAASTKGTAGALERMSGSIETVQLAFGQAIKPLVIFGATMVSDIAQGATPIIQEFGRGLRNVDWDGVREGFIGIGTGLSAAGPALKRSGDDLAAINALFSVTGEVVLFAARHIDLLVKALPLLVIGFAAVKAAQLAANIAAAASPAIRIVEIITIRNQTRALTALTAAQTTGTVAQIASNAATATGTKLTARQRIAIVASAVAQKAVTVATKAWAVAQWAINTALTANPIGIVIAAVALLVTGIIVAYKKSETFKKIVDGAFKAVAKSGKWMWDNVLKPTFKFMRGGFDEVVRSIRSMRQGIGDAWEGIKDKTLGAAKYIIDKVLWMAEKVLAAAVKAFGWAPGIGEQVKKAHAKVKDLRVKLNDEFNLINDETVTVSVQASAYEVYRGKKGPVKVYKAQGGPIEGGTPGKDSVHVMAMPGEHVWTTKEVKNAGGHGAMFALRSKARQGMLHMANGGPVIGANTPRVSGLGDTMQNYSSKVGELMAQQAGTAMRAELKKVLASGKAGGVLKGRTGAYGGVQPHVAAVGDLINRMYGPMVIGGVGSRPGPSDHPSGHALDFMTYDNFAKGDAIARTLSASYRRFAISYLIWKQRIWNPPNMSWQGMEDRGSPTANHYDHVHASFLRKYQHGTDYVPKTGPAIVHKGEKIIPAYRNTGRQRIMLDFGGGKVLTGWMEDVVDDRIAADREMSGQRERAR